MAAERMGLNFCGTFISSILLLSDLAGTNLVQTLPQPKSYCTSYFCEVYLQEL